MRGAHDGEEHAAQHRTIVDRPVIDARGALRLARGYDTDTPLRRLANLKDADGTRWLTPEEISAASQLRADWEFGEIGLVRGSDWSAPPLGSSARGTSSARENLMVSQCDARRRVADALDFLPPPLRRVVERVCLHQDGLEALERAENWPARSGKLALKLGLAQIASRHSGP